MQAYIGGIVKYSETDWPGKASMVIFFSGCDFNCPFCRTPEILGFKKELSRDLREIKKEIENNFDINAVVFTGGEPCLQKLALFDLAKFCKEHDLAVAVETNGSRPDTIKALIDEKLVDFIRLDFKAPLNDADDEKNNEHLQKVTESSTFFRPIQQVADDFRQTLEILKKNLASESNFKNKIMLELRTTIVPNLMFKRESLLSIASEINKLINESDEFNLGRIKWVLQKFTPYEKILSKRFQSINSPSDEFLDTMLGVIMKEYPKINVEIRSNMSSLSLAPEIILENKEAEE